MHCPWCHNPETRPLNKAELFYENLCTGCGECNTGCLYGARFVSGSEMNIDRVFDYITEDIVYYERSGGGITISGGEPLLQADFCAKFAEKCKESKISVIIDTAGDVDFCEFEKILQFTDHFYFDIKTSMDNYSMLGGNGTGVYDNLKRLNSLCDVVVRMPVIPGFNDDMSIIAGISGFLADCGIKEVHLLPFHRFGSGKYKAMGLTYDYTEVEADVDIDCLKQVFLKKFIKCETM